MREEDKGKKQAGRCAMRCEHLCRTKRDGEIDIIGWSKWMGGKWSAVGIWQSGFSVDSMVAMSSGNI